MPKDRKLDAEDGGSEAGEATEKNRMEFRVFCSTVYYLCVRCETDIIHFMQFPARGRGVVRCVLGFSVSVPAC